MYKVVVDAGHGGTDLGVQGKSSYEKDLNLNEAVLLKKYLKEYGVEVSLTRELDEYININNRLIDDDATVLVSFHKNGISHGFTSGCEVYYSTKKKEDLKHANALSKIISTTLNTKDNGGKVKLNANQEDYYKIINLALEKDIPHIFLIQTDYMSNSDSEYKLKKNECVKEYTKKIADYIAMDILKISNKLKIKVDDEEIEIDNIVKGDKVYVEINELIEKSNLPITYRKDCYI